jgi:ABC-type sugar transport system substrate-binding protein
MKQNIAIILSICLMFVIFTGCGTGNKQVKNLAVTGINSPAKTEPVVKAPPKKPLLIACIVNQDDQYMKLLQLGMTDAAQTIGANVITANTYGKLDREIELINMYIKSGVDGICIHPVSVDLSVPILSKAKKNGIKVISAGISIQDKFQIGYI